MELLFIDELRRELQRRRDFIGRHAVLFDDLFVRHPAVEAAEDASDRDSRPSNHRFAVLHGGIDRDAFGQVEIVTPGV
jgi:hypothetical protein